MISVKQAREALCQDADMEMTWTGKRGEMIKMREISGNPDEVIDIPPKLAYLMNEVACVLMCIEHIEFMPYCLGRIILTTRPSHS